MAASNNHSIEGPISLQEDEVTGDRFLIYHSADGLRLDIQFLDETLWMTQAQIAELFAVGVPAVSKHISNIYSDEELLEETTLSKMERVRIEGDRTVTREIEHYNLDVVISVGYRVSSAQATAFRRWATGVLVQYAKKGFVVDSKRLKSPDNFDRVKELREIIRDIRSDEANIYRELRSICAMCRDYEAKSEDARTFYMQTQAKLIFAVTSHTPSEVTHSRADHRKDNMGLTAWAGETVRKADVTVSKNYLSETEIKELNRLTEIVLTIFEDQLDIGKIIVMKDAETLLDKQLEQLNRLVLRDGGRISSSQAHRKAHDEYTLFDERRKKLRHEQADIVIAELAKEGKSLSKRGK